MNNKKLLEQLQKMNHLSMENMINQLRQKTLNKRLKKDTITMLNGLQSQLLSSQETTTNSSSLLNLLPSSQETNANSISLSDELMSLLNKLS